MVDLPLENIGLRGRLLKEEVGSVHNKEWFPFDFPLILVFFDHFLSEILGALTSNRR